MLSALSAVGSISPSTASVIKAIKTIQSVQKNRNISVGSQKKIGRGLYLTRSASGAGFYLKPFHRN